MTSPAFDRVQAGDKVEHPTQRVNELWQTDFTQFKVVGLDDFSRYLLAWRLSATMAAIDVQETRQWALDQTGIQHVPVQPRPRRLSDHGPAFIADALRDYLSRLDIDHLHGRPLHPQTQGTIER